MLKKPHHAIIKACDIRGITIDWTGPEYVFKFGPDSIAPLEIADASAKDGLARMIALTEGKAPKSRDEDEGESDDDEGEDSDELADESNDEADLADAEGEEGEEESEGRSIVKRVYRKKYKPFHNTNGDELAAELTHYLETTKDDGSPGLDRPKLERFAVANGFWDDKYRPLNNGQVRMNVGNKLRAKIRKDPEWQPKWPK